MAIEAVHYRALLNLVVGRGVLDCWVAGVVLVLIGWSMLIRIVLRTDHSLRNEEAYLGPWHWRLR